MSVYRGPGTFFVTITTNARRPLFREHDLTSSCEKTLRDTCAKEGADLVAYCFMPDHVHLLVGLGDDGELIRLIKSFKQRTGWWFRNRLRAGGLKASPTGDSGHSSLWQKSFYDHVLRHEEDVADVVRYILENPVRASLSASADEYPYAWSAYSSTELI